MRTTLELIRLLFPDAHLASKTEEMETYKYSEDSYLLEIDVAKEEGESRIILMNEVVHTEKFETKHLLGHLPYLRGLAMGKVMELALEGIGLTGEDA